MTDTEQGTTAETGTLQEELENLKREKENLVHEFEVAATKVKELEQALSEREGKVAMLEQSILDAEKRLAVVNETLTQAVAGYRALVVEVNPGVLADLISGESIEEVNESLTNAQALVSRVRRAMAGESSLGQDYR